MPGEIRFYFRFMSILDDAPRKRQCKPMYLKGLYDLLRPYIISIYHLETLSELCSILKLEMLDDHILSNQNELKARLNIAIRLLIRFPVRLPVSYFNKK